MTKLNEQLTWQSSNHWTCAIFPLASLIKFDLKLIPAFAGHSSPSNICSFVPDQISLSKSCKHESGGRIVWEAGNLTFPCYGAVFYLKPNGKLHEHWMFAALIHSLFSSRNENALMSLAAAARLITMCNCVTFSFNVQIASYFYRVLCIVFSLRLPGYLHEKIWEQPEHHWIDPG